MAFFNSVVFANFGVKTNRMLASVLLRTFQLDGAHAVLLPFLGKEPKTSPVGELPLRLDFTEDMWRSGKFLGRGSYGEVRRPGPAQQAKTVFGRFGAFFHVLARLPFRDGHPSLKSEDNRLVIAGHRRREWRT